MQAAIKLSECSNKDGQAQTSNFFIDTSLTPCQNNNNIYCVQVGHNG